MEVWQWILVVLAALSAAFVMGSVIWGIFDVIREDRMDQTVRAIWVLAILVLPLFGIIAWLYAKPRLGIPNSGINLKETL